MDEQNNEIHENWCSNIDETTVTLFPVLYIHNKIIISMDTVVFSLICITSFQCINKTFKKIKLFFHLEISSVIAINCYAQYKHHHFEY